MPPIEPHDQRIEAVVQPQTPAELLVDELISIFSWASLDTNEAANVRTSVWAIEAFDGISLTALRSFLGAHGGTEVTDAVLETLATCLQVAIDDTKRRARELAERLEPKQPLTDSAVLSVLRSQETFELREPPDRQALLLAACVGTLEMRHCVGIPLCGCPDPTDALQRLLGEPQSIVALKTAAAHTLLDDWMLKYVNRN